MDEHANDSSEEPGEIRIRYLCRILGFPQASLAPVKPPMEW